MTPLLGGVAAVVSAAIWAFSSTYMTEPARKWGGRATNLFKSTIATVFFVATLLIAYGPESFRLAAPVWGRFFVSGVLGLAIADTAYLSALKHIGPTLTAIVYETSGIFTCVLGAIFLGERLSAGEIVAIALVIGGVLLALLENPPAPVLVSGAPPDGRSRSRGAWLALFAASVHATGLVFNKDAFDALKATHGTDGMQAALTAGSARMGAAMVALFVFGVATRSVRRQTRTLREAEGWRATFLPALAGSFLAMVTMQLALTTLKSGVAAVLLSMTPIFTIPVEWKVLGHRPSARAAGGALIALAGVYLLTRR